MKKKIWFDFENTPQVNFFYPIISELKSLGYNTIITTRPFGQTEQLAKLRGLEFTSVGSKKISSNYFAKAILLLHRGFLLYRKLRKENIKISVSHGSRGMSIAAKLLKCFNINFFDYDHADLEFLVKCSDKIYVPDITIEIFKKKFTYAEDKFLGYPGIKENTYIYNCKFNDNILNKIGIAKNKITVLCRPPANKSHYANNESDFLFNSMIDKITKKDCIILISPRHKYDIDYYEKKFNCNKIIVLKEIFDGLSLIKAADLVLGGGGTMNREACIIGTPVLSLFKGKKGAIDSYLNKLGLLFFIENVSDLDLIDNLLKKKMTSAFCKFSKENTLSFIVERLKEDCMSVM